MQENTILSDTLIDPRTYKYYSFTLLEDLSASSLSFYLDTLHGDADIYVSKKDKFPTKADYEKSSVKSQSDREDIVTFNESLAGTYYLGVYSAQYSSYHILAKVSRNGLSY